MGKFMEALVLASAISVIVLQFPSGVVGNSKRDVGVSVVLEWTDLHDWLLCSDVRQVAGPGVEIVGALAGQIHFVQFHLSQWHALIALEDTGSCTTESAVVAYASHRILSHYYPWAIDKFIDPLLNRHITTLKLSTSQSLLGQRIGEAVADEVASKRKTPKPFSLRAVKSTLTAASPHPTPGLYRYLNASAAGQDAMNFVLHNAALSNTFLLKDPLEFIKNHILGAVRAPKVPSPEFDRNWDALKDIGRIDWPGRTLIMNLTADYYGCQRVNSSTCSIDGKMHKVMRAILPPKATVAETVTLLAKLSVAIFDTGVVLDTLQYGFWFWRPVMAFRSGDAHHAAIPSWTPYAFTPPHPEFPSGTVINVAAAVRILELHFGDDVGAFSVPGSGVNLPSCGTAGLLEPTFNYTSLADVVHTAQLARMYAGAHWNSSVEAAALAGRRVGEWIHEHWAQRTPTGVLPDSKYLKVVAKLPNKAGEWSPIRFESIQLK
ncbi:hypothetical protein M758_7G022700 [Ceratodon purpureus]|nr:hypothetical protein M758_7G022700 [Ceratodon purpureus]